MNLWRRKIMQIAEFHGKFVAISGRLSTEQGRHSNIG